MSDITSSDSETFLLGEQDEFTSYSPENQAIILRGLSERTYPFDWRMLGYWASVRSAARGVFWQLRNLWRALTGRPSLEVERDPMPEDES